MSGVLNFIPDTMFLSLAIIRVFLCPIFYPIFCIVVLPCNVAFYVIFNIDIKEAWFNPQFFS